MDQQKAEQLWEQYRANRCDATRNALIEHYYEYVVVAVVRKREKVRNTIVDYEDYLTDGLLALMRAISSYDPKRGIPFAAYARICVNNAISNANRNAHRMAHPGGHVDIIPLSNTPFETLERADRSGPTHNTANFLSEFPGLSKRQRLILILHYVEGVDLRHIAGHLDIHETWVYREHDRAKELVRQKLAA